MMTAVRVVRGMADTRGVSRGAGPGHDAADRELGIYGGEHGERARRSVAEVCNRSRGRRDEPIGLLAAGRGGAPAVGEPEHCRSAGDRNGCTGDHPAAERTRPAVTTWFALGTPGLLAARSCKRPAVPPPAPDLCPSGPGFRPSESEVRPSAPGVRRPRPASDDPRPASDDPRPASDDPRPASDDPRPASDHRRRRLTPPCSLRGEASGGACNEASIGAPPQKSSTLVCGGRLVDGAVRASVWAGSDCEGVGVSGPVPIGTRSSGGPNQSRRNGTTLLGGRVLSPFVCGSSGSNTCAGFLSPWGLDDVLGRANIALQLVQICFN